MASATSKKTTKPTSDSSAQTKAAKEVEVRPVYLDPSTPAMTDEEAEAYVQEVADRCIEMVDDDFSDETLWDDLCREAVGMGGLGTLLALTPCHIPRSRIEKWRDAAAEGLARLEQRNDEEVGFQRPYHANLSRVFRVLLSRSAG